MNAIGWCEETWNPITGCSPISAGCRNCYAQRMAVRLALAERHRPRDAVQSMPGGRLHGRCGLCGEIHRSPDMRYRCTGCGLVICVAHAQELEYVCPDCGSRLDLSPEVEP